MRCLKKMLTAATFDEVTSCAIDRHGMAHFVGPRYKMTNLDITALSWSYFPYTDGIVYWNESMPAIDSSIFNNVDSLVAHKMWIGSMMDIDGNGEIDFPEVPSGSYPWGELQVCRTFEFYSNGSR